MANNQIKIGVGFQIDKSGLSELQNSLKQIQIEAAKAGGSNKLTNELKQSAQAAEQLENILNQSWNSKLNQLDLSKVSRSIKDTYGNVQNLKKILEQSGTTGANAYNHIASAILNTNLKIKEGNKLLDEMATSMANTVKWGITSSIFNNITNSIAEAFHYTKKLDSSLNDIRIVTDKSAESMEKFARQANEAAKGLGASTLDYTEASLIYYQQGLNDEDVAARAETTLKAANVTGQYAEEVSEQLTAVWNGYKVSAQEAELYVDKLAAVAASTASDLEELSTGMSKVASAANSMGVDIDQLNAQLATIVSVTRQAPESVGTALKTIYARMSDLKVGGTDEDGLGLGDVSGTMESMGIQVLDASGNLREMGDVIEEVAAKWNTWTDAQKTAMAQVMAGKRQYNNLVALFENWDMYTDSLNESANAAGTLQQQQDIYLESTAAHLQQLRTEAEETYDILFDQDTVNSFTDALTGVLDIFNGFIDSLGGGMSTMATLGLMVSNIFSKQIGKAISGQIQNIQDLKDNADAEKLKQDIITSHQSKGENIISNAALDSEVENTKKILSVQKQISQEKANELITLQQEIAIGQQRLEGIDQYKTIAKELLEIENTEILNYEELNEKFFNGIQQKQEEIQLNKNSLKTYQEIATVNGATYDTQEDKVKTQLALLKMLEKTNAEEQKNIDIKQLINKIQNGEKLTNKEIELLKKGQNKLTKEQSAQLNQLKIGIQGVKDAEEGVRQEIEDQVNARQKLLDTEISNAEQDAAIEGLIRGLTGLFSTLSTTKGAIKTFGDETLTTEEKFKKFGSTLAATGGLLLSNFTSIKDIGKNGTAALLKLSNALNGTNAASVAAAGGWKALGLSIASAKISLLGFQIALGPLAGVITAVTAAIVLAVKAYNKKRDAMIEEQKLLKETQEAYQKTKEEYNNLKSSLEDYTGAKKSIEELKKDTIEWTEAVQILNEKVLNLMSLYPELAQYVTSDENGILNISEEGIQQVRDSYFKKTQTMMQAQYNQALKTNEVERAYQVQQTARQIGNIKYTTNAGIQASTVKPGYGMVDELSYQTYAAGQEFSIQSSQIEGILNTILDNDKISITDDVDTLVTALEGIYDLNNDELRQVVENLKDNSKEIYNLEKTIEATNAETQLLEQQKGIGLLQQTGLFEGVDTNTLNAIYKMRQDELAVGDADLKAAKEQLANNAEAYAAAAGLTGDSFAIEGDKIVAKDKEGNTISSQLLVDVEQQVAELAKVTTVFATTAKEDIEKITNLNAKADKKYQGLGNYMSTFMGDSAGSFTGATGVELQNIQKVLKNSEDFWQQYQEYGFESADAFKNQVIQNLEYAIDNVDGIQLAKNMINSAAITSEIQGALAKGTEADLDEKQIAHLNQLEAKYKELGAIQDRNSHEYLAMLRQITEQEEENARRELEIARQKNEQKAEELLSNIETLQDLLKEPNGLSEDDIESIKIELEADVTEFESVMDNLQDNYKEMKILIDADLKSDVDEAFGLTNELEKLQKLIPEDLTVTFEEAQNLIAQGYAGILENAKETSENSIKLDKETMNTFINNRQAELESDRQAKIGQLENQRAVLITQRDALKQKLDALKEAAKAENATDAATALQKAKTADKEYKVAVQQLNEELKSEAKAATEEEKINEQLFNDLGDMYEVNSLNQQQAEVDATNKQKEEISTRIQNVKALYDAYTAIGAAVVESASGPVKTQFPTTELGGGGGTSVTGSTETSSKDVTANELTAEDIAQYAEELFNKDKNEFDATIDALITATEAQIDSVDQQIGSIDAGIAALKSAGKSLDKAQTKAGTRDGNSKKEEKKAKDEIDRYWELNKAIENVEESLSDLDKKQDKLYGRELINSLKEENQLLAQQADRYQALAAAQRQEASELQGLLSSYGVVFDAQGGVANYLAATQAALETYNQAVAAYNAMLIDEATFQAAERAYENFKSTLARYETLYYQEMIDTQNKLEEIHRQELENNLQAWEVEIQLKLDMNELERQWDDFFKDINNNFKLLYEDLDAEMSNLMDKTLTYQGGDGDIATIISGIKDVTAEIDKMQSGGESGMFESVSQAQEKLKELNDQLQDSALAMRELWETAWDTYLEGIDQAADKLDDLMDRYDNINEEIEYQRELIELLYGDEAYELMNQYYNAQEKNTKAEIDSLKLQADLWKAQYEEALAIDEANGTLSEDTQKFYELWQDAQQGLNDKVTEYIELLQNDYKNTISDIISDLEKSITGGAALDEVKEQWELLKEQSEKYYDDVERIYELSSLASKYENSIINTSNLENQQKLQEMYNKEMKYLENKKFLSEYDLKVANAKYDMTLKQIMLEEAQQNKTSMKLTRGADGNWSYQYVADEDDIASKQQALLDATSQYYQITKDGYHQNLEDMMSAQANYLEKLQEINEKYMNDEEMRATKAQELYEAYYGDNGILTLLYAENETVRTNLSDATLQSILTFYAIDEENYALMTEAEQALIDGLKDGTITNYEEMLDKATQVCEDTLSSWESSAQGIADAWYVDNGYSVKASMLQAYKDLTKANTDYQTAVDILEKSVEQDFGPDGIGGALDSAKNKTEELDNKTAELCDHAESNLARYRQAVNSIGQAWESVKDQIRSAISLVQQYLNAVGSAQSAAISGLSSVGGIGLSGGSSGSGLNGGSSSSNSNGGSGKSNSSSNNSNNGYYYVQTGKTSSGERLFSLYSSSGQSIWLSQPLKNILYHPIYSSATQKGQLYNTGGYTGSWNNGDTDGRLAWLHQKELVLNSSDTANILDAVHTIRGITNIGESINQSIMNGISQMVLSLMNLGNYGKGYSLATAEGSQESVFNINANFPNANDVESIREAIMSLPNLASQYIARNRK